MPAYRQVHENTGNAVLSKGIVSGSFVLTEDFNFIIDGKGRLRGGLCVVVLTKGRQSLVADNESFLLLSTSTE